MALLKIKNLHVRTEVGFSPHETGKRQDVLLNIDIVFDSNVAEKSDNPQDTLDYKRVTKQIISLVEGKKYQLVEALAHDAIELIMTDERVKHAVVEADKPHALRFSESVSITLERSRD